MTTTKAGRPRGSYETNSVRTRLMDLLVTHRGDWMTLSDMVREYSERFGPVNPKTLRRTLYRIIERRDEVGKMWARYKPADHGGVMLEILVACEPPEEEDE